jgi:crotonobetainyl-CoA:carnitine CoA-transferase CaiB-like acyl-CoA transferase
MMLADMGADVIKIEDVNTPDYMRFYPPYIKSESAGFVALTGPSEAWLESEDPKGVGIFLSLVKTADIVIEQFGRACLTSWASDMSRPGKLRKTSSMFPSPDTASTALTQKMPDTTSINRVRRHLSSAGSRETGPLLPGPQLADVAGGAYMSMIACLCALWSREKTGKGQFVDVAMLDCVLPLITLQMAHYQATAINLAPGDLPLAGGLACYGSIHAPTEIHSHGHPGKQVLENFL